MYQLLEEFLDKLLKEFMQKLGAIFRNSSPLHGDCDLPELLKKLLENNDKTNFCNNLVINS